MFAKPSRPLTVLNAAYPLATVSMDSVGGAEQVVAQLDASLAQAGHHSLVVASEGSQVMGTLLPTPARRGNLDNEIQQAAAVSHITAIYAALKHWPVDVVHLHGFDFHRYLPTCPEPVLATLHLPPHWYPPEIFSSACERVFYNCVSNTQLRGCPPCRQMLPPVENGISTRFFAARHAKRHFALALGRICPEKGFHLALDAAKRARAPMLLAGRVYAYPAHE